MADRSLQKIGFIALWLFILNLGSRLLFLYYDSAESTDSIQYMTHGFFAYRSHFYPLLIRVIHLFGPSLQTSGRFVSMLMASLCIFPIFSIAKSVFDRRTAVYSSLFFTGSPVIFDNSISAMADSTHLFFFLWAFYYGWKSFLNYNKKDIGLFVLFSGVAVIVRPESLLFFPLLMLLFFIGCKKFTVLKSINLFFISAFFWYLFLAQVLIKAKVIGSFGYLGWFKGSVVTVTPTRFLSFLTSYIKALPFVVVYPLFALFIYGVWILFKKDFQEIKNSKLWLIFLSYFLLALIIPLSFFASWSPRFIIPIVPLFLITASFGITQLKGYFEKKWAKSNVVIFCLISSLVLTTVSISASRDSFGDVRRSAEYIKNNLKQATVYSDEIPKTSFWSKNKIYPYQRKNIKPGVYVVLHSYTTDLNREIAYLRGNYKVKFLYEAKSKKINIYGLMGIAPKYTDYPEDRGPIARAQKKLEYKSVVLYMRSLK